MLDSGNMEDLENKIEEAACKFAKEGHLNSAMSFALGVESEVAKEYWQQGMYSEEEVKNILILYHGYLRRFTGNIGNIAEIDQWFEQNKKK